MEREGKVNDQSYKNPWQKEVSLAIQCVGFMHEQRSYLPMTRIFTCDTQDVSLKIV
jgi:hypothetical protein